MTIHQTSAKGVWWAGEEVTTDANLEVAWVRNVDRRNDSRFAVGNLHFDVTVAAALRLVGLDAEATFVV